METVSKLQGAANINQISRETQYTELTGLPQECFGILYLVKFGNSHDLLQNN